MKPEDTHPCRAALWEDVSVHIMVVAMLRKPNGMEKLVGDLYGRKGRDSQEWGATGKDGARDWRHYCEWNTRTLP